MPFWMGLHMIHLLFFFLGVILFPSSPVSIDIRPKFGFHSSLGSDLSSIFGQFNFSPVGSCNRSFSCFMG